MSLYVPATFTSYQRAQRMQYPDVALLKIDGVEDKKETEFYIGKRCAYFYKPTEKSAKNKNGYRVVWGKILAPHGNNGVVKARFRKNLNSRAIGKEVRVFLYPSKI